MDRRTFANCFGLLEDSAARPLLAELKFPGYLADQQRDSGIDIAGVMIDHLAAKVRPARQAFGR